MPPARRTGAKQTGAGQPETWVRLPATSNPKRTRELDVLLRHQVTGDPVLVVFECKNERKPVGVEYVDAFFGSSTTSESSRRRASSSRRSAIRMTLSTAPLPVGSSFLCSMGSTWNGWPRQ